MTLPTLTTGNEAQIAKATERRARLFESFIAAVAEGDAMVAAGECDAEGAALYTRNRDMIANTFAACTDARVWLDVSFHRSANDWLNGDLCCDSQHSLRHYLPFAK